MLEQHSCDKTALLFCNQRRFARELERTSERNHVSHTKSGGSSVLDATMRQ